MLLYVIHYLNELHTEQCKKIAKWNVFFKFQLIVCIQRTFKKNSREINITHLAYSVQNSCVFSLY